MELMVYFITTFVAGVLFYVNQAIRSNIYHARHADSMGCKPPVRSATIEPSGIASFIFGMRADHDKQFLNWLEENVNKLQIRENRIVGSLSMRTPVFSDIVLTSEPQNIQAMLASKFQHFCLGNNRINNFKPLAGNGIFAADGKQWEHSRRLLRPQFSRNQISDLSLEEKHVSAMMTVLESRIVSNGWTEPVDLLELFFRLTLDSASEFLFGESINSQLEVSIESLSGSSSIKGVDFASALDKAQHSLAMGGRIGGLYWLFHTPSFHRNVKKVHMFVDYFVQLALEQGSAKHKNSLDANGDTKYIFLQALAEHTQDPMELRSQLLNILIAGRDSTASTLGWFMFIMADTEINGQVYNCLRAAILGEFGTYTNPKNLTFERLKNCKYLQWCINETLRLYPVVPINVRTAVVDTLLPTGGGSDGSSPIYVKKGDDVMYSVHLMHRRKDLWGEDAEKFCPERWETRKPDWDYLPFNGGPRICIGQQFALTEIAYVLVRLIQRVDQIDGSVRGSVKHGLTLTNRPGDGVKISLHFAE